MGKRRRIKRLAGNFDNDIKSAVEKVMGVPFETLDCSQFSVSEGSVLALSYREKVILVLLNGHFYDTNGNKLN